MSDLPIRRRHPADWEDIVRSEGDDWALHFMSVERVCKGRRCTLCHNVRHFYLWRAVRRLARGEAK